MSTTIVGTEIMQSLVVDSKPLSDRLKELEKHGLIKREAFILESGHFARAKEKGDFAGDISIIGSSDRTILPKLE